MKTLLLHRIPSLILISLINNISTSGQLSKKLNATNCHVYNSLKKFVDLEVVQRTRIKNIIEYNLTEKGIYYAERVKDIYYYKNI